MALSVTMSGRLLALHRGTLATTADLRQRVVDHRQTVRARAAEDGFVDLEAAEAVVRTCLALLDDWSRSSPSGWRTRVSPSP